MPRGYLKHSDNICKNKKRGSNGRKDQGKRNKDRSHQKQIHTSFDEWKEEYLQYDDANSKQSYLEDDFVKIKTFDHEMNHYGECVICAEEKPLVRLMVKCKHAQACRSCLHRLYITNAPKDVSNYPLKCFFPSCDKIIREENIKRHITSSDQEIIRFHRFTVLAKAYSEGQKVVHCPTCDHPFYCGKFNRRIVRCKVCEKTFVAGVIPPDLIKAVESFRPDDKGENDGWAQCPYCHIMISKGNGCDHMRCFCGNDFSWRDARDKSFTGNMKVALIVDFG